MTTLSKPKLPRVARLGLGLSLACYLLGARMASGQIVLTNVSVINVTPSGFSVAASVSPAITPSTVVKVLVFADPNGTKRLAGQVGVEYYPLNTGDPAAANAYSTLQSKAALRQDSMNLGLIYARVTYCAPQTTYYYQITVTTTNGQSAVWPVSGPLPSATTAQQNSFVAQSQQLIITLNDSNPTGSILLLSTSNSASLLAAVVGDGVGTNQAFFNLNDLIAASGGTNYSPVGSQLLTATVLGSSPGGLTQTYDLIFSNTFSVGQSSAVALGGLATTISLGEGVMLIGGSTSVPITLDCQGPLVSLSFVLNIPSNLFTAISLLPTLPALGAASLAVVSSNTLQLSFTAATGLNLEGDQQIAQLHLTAASNQSSAFVPLWPQAPQGTNANPSIPNTFFVQPGRAVLIGSQPLLDAQLVGGSRNLVLYGVPGLSYQLQSLTNQFPSANWSDFLSVPMTNLTQVFSNLDPTPVVVFYRAYVLNADPPLLQAFHSNGDFSLLAFGITGANYVLQTSSNLSTTVAWRPLLSYTLTNSFEYFTNLGPSSPVYYRIKKQ
jgi:hypothetical protein